MSSLKVRFDEPEHGWIGLFILRDGEERVCCHVSQIYDSFDPLITALGAMLDERGERVVVWMEEPAELELLFSRRDDVVRVEVTSFSDHHRPIERPEAEFSFAGSYDEVCLPFWRALRSLEGRYSSEEFARRWRRPFPHQALAQLTQLLGKAR